MRHVAVLGATGSIGASALDLIGRHPDTLGVHTLAAGHNVAALLALCARHRPRHAVIADPAGFSALRDGLRAAGLETEAHAGMEAICALVQDPACDTVVAAIVGAAGLDSTLAAAGAGKRILLANKESLVMAGELLMQAAHRGRACVVPVDSEHTAIFQCLPPTPCGGATGTAPDTVQRIVLTASGGPFRGMRVAELATVTAAQAVAHPNWSMGPKISVDSATLMNKGLEVIEARHLFGRPRDGFDVLVHPQSLVHSMVEFVDGSTLAQLGLPDMRTALAVGFAWPERIGSGVGRLDLLAHGRLDFEMADGDAFPCLPLAFAALAEGGTAPAILNASNEVAVAAFLQGRIGFLAIPALVAATLAAVPASRAASLDDLRDVDARARRHATAALVRHAA